MTRMLKRMGTNIVLLVAAATSLAGCTMWKEKAATDWSSATGAEHYERLMFKEIKARNWAEVERHLAPTFVAVLPGGSRDRAASLESLKPLALTDYSLGDFDVRPAGADMVVTYTAILQGTYNGQPLPSERLRMMTVWQQVNKGWAAIAHSAVPEPH